MDQGCLNVTIREWFHFHADIRQLDTNIQNNAESKCYNLANLTLLEIHDRSRSNCDDGPRWRHKIMRTLETLAAAAAAGLGHGSTTQ